MNRLWCILLFFILQSSCDESKRSDQSIESSVVEEIRELDSLSSINIYELDYGNREFPGRNGFKRKERVVSDKSMDYFDFIALQSIVNDSNSYTTFGSACFYPNIGLVVSDRISSSVSELYICLHCNNHKVYDSNGVFINIERNDGKYGFSKRARKKIRSLIENYEFNTKDTYSLFYDYPVEYLENQIQNGLDSVEVMKSILDHYSQYEDGYRKEQDNIDTVSYVGLTKRSADFFVDENIGSIAYEYDNTGGDKFTSYLGMVNNSGAVYHVCSVFRRVQAAIVMHGHSSLYFLDNAYEIVAEYSISNPDELPKGVSDNKLEFQIEGNTYLVEGFDLSEPYLCIEQGVLCIPKVE